MEKKTMKAKTMGNKYDRIETERLILREWTPNDCAAVVDGLNNENVAKYLSSAPFPYTMADAEKFINSRKVNTSEKMDFAITLKPTGEVIGGCGGRLKEDGVWGGGIWINEKYHKHGYGAEAYLARTKFMFDNCGANEIESGYYFDNLPSKKMHEKIGFRSTGKTEMHHCTARGGGEFLCHITVIRKEDL
jgi:RimJ/RimL family protein N-acetyltransferase